MSRDTREALNQPFEFDEVLVDHRARQSLRRAPKIEDVFAKTEAPDARSPFSTRKLSVRLRTINNACDAPFKMQDGRPITEVSLYGSRDRQYLIGPYWAVRRLMKGVLPGDERREFLEDISTTSELLKVQLGHVEAFLEDPESNSTEAKVMMAYQQRSQAEKVDTRLCADAECRLEETRWSTRLALGIDLMPERLSDVRAYAAFLIQTLGTLDDLKTEIAAADWYWGWSTAMARATERGDQLGKAFRVQRDALRGPNWPKRRFAWPAERPRRLDFFG